MLTAHAHQPRQIDSPFAGRQFVQRQDFAAPQPATHSTRELLQRAFRKLFEEEPGALHETVEDALLRTAYEFCHHNQVHTAKLLCFDPYPNAELLALGAQYVSLPELLAGLELLGKLDTRAALHQHHGFAHRGVLTSAPRPVLISMAQCLRVARLVALIRCETGS